MQKFSINNHPGPKIFEFRRACRIAPDGTRVSESEIGETPESLEPVSQASSISEPMIETPGSNEYTATIGVTFANTSVKTEVVSQSSAEVTDKVEVEEQASRMVY
jgi:hypothetical protein